MELSSEALYTLAGVALNQLIFLVWRPWAAAYTGEKAKNLARKEDIQRLMDEVKSLTTAQKSIEMTLTGQLWETQARYDQKKEVYGALFKSLHELVEAYRYLKMFVAYPQAPSVSVQNPFEMQVAAYKALSMQYGFACIFLDKRVSEILAGFRYQRTVQFGLTPPFEWIDEAISDISQVEREVIEIAIQDLRIGRNEIDAGSPS